MRWRSSRCRLRGKQPQSKFHVRWTSPIHTAARTARTISSSGKSKRPVIGKLCWISSHGPRKKRFRTHSGDRYVQINKVGIVTPRIRCSIGLNNIFSKEGSFDLRWMGLIHGLLFLNAAYLLQRLLAGWGRWRRFFLWAAIVYCFGDVMYVSYFNSFYMDAAAYVFLLLALVLFLRAVAW